MSAIEVATIMLLEVSYGWPPEMTGLSFVVIAAGTWDHGALMTATNSNCTYSTVLV